MWFTCHEGSSCETCHWWKVRTVSRRLDLCSCPGSHWPMSSRTIFYFHSYLAGSCCWQRDHASYYDHLSRRWSNSFCALLHFCPKAHNNYAAKMKFETLICSGSETCSDWCLSWFSCYLLTWTPFCASHCHEIFGLGAPLRWSDSFWRGTGLGHGWRLDRYAVSAFPYTVTRDSKPGFSGWRCTLTFPWQFHLFWISSRFTAACTPCAFGLRPVSFESTSLLGARIFGSFCHFDPAKYSNFLYRCRMCSLCGRKFYGGSREDPLTS